MTKQRKIGKSPSEQTSDNEKGRSALIPAPEHLAQLMHLVNLLPKSLRRSTEGINSESNTPPKSISIFFVRDEWDTRSDKGAIWSIYYLQRLVDELPLELQAFILHDDNAHHIKVDYSPGYAPVFDPYHFQPSQNITLLDLSEDELQVIIAEAKRRLDIETPELIEPKPTAQKEALEPVYIPDVYQKDMDYQIGDRKFSRVGLSNLANRARQRFFFILAAEEILDALVGPNTQKKLNNAWYVEKSGTTQGYLYISNDEVKLYPAVLYSFVVGIQASRVRRCEICSSYFWAGRKDKKVCSERCGATRRKRQERQRYFDLKIGVRKRKGKRRKEK